MLKHLDGLPGAVVPHLRLRRATPRVTVRAMTDTAPTTPTTPPTANAPKITEAERLRQARAKIDARLAEIAKNEAARKRRDETKGKIILGALAQQAGLAAQLAGKASERDREHLRGLGWIGESAQ